MCKKLITLLLFIVSIHITKAQNEFITIWKPGTAQQIEFPGRGTNFRVYWEEIGYLQHNGTINTITSDRNFTIAFGSPLNPVPANATYRIKISNGSGTFDQVRFFDNTVVPVYINPDHSKILAIQQWGNIHWTTFSNSFVFCENMNVTATDVPDLSAVSSLREMFYLCTSMVGNPSFNNWNTSTITDMYYMFGDCGFFNQPIENWNVSNVTDMSYMFDAAVSFNQSLRNWKTSNVTTMQHMFHGASLFNQDIGNWDTGKVTNMAEMFHETSFNQNIGSWKLTALTNAEDLFLNSGMNCQNYDHTLYGWSLSSATPDNISISSASPLVYSHPAAVSARNYLMTSKNWNISGDTYNGACQSVLGVSDVKTKNDLSIYPNPATDFIFVNSAGAEKFIIFDLSGKMVLKGMLSNGKIDIRKMVSGNYILQLISDKNIQNLKFIKP